MAYLIQLFNVIEKYLISYNQNNNFLGRIALVKLKMAKNVVHISLLYKLYTCLYTNVPFFNVQLTCVFTERLVTLWNN